MNLECVPSKITSKNKDEVIKKFRQITEKISQQQKSRNSKFHIKEYKKSIILAKVNNPGKKVGQIRKKCGKGNGTPLQYSCLENPMDGGAWKAAVHGVTEVQTRLSDFTFTFHFPALEKEMATHSSVLAWRIPGMREPGGLPSLGSHRVGHD